LTCKCCAVCWCNKNAAGAGGLRLSSSGTGATAWLLTSAALHTTIWPSAPACMASQQQNCVRHEGGGLAVQISSVACDCAIGDFRTSISEVFASTSSTKSPFHVFQVQGGHCRAEQQYMIELRLSTSGHARTTSLVHSTTSGMQLAMPRLCSTCHNDM